jgi:pyrimidine deaminase RibD-like protein
MKLRPEELDSVLEDLCEIVLRGMRSRTDFGMVSACIIDPNGNHVYGLNYPDANGRRVHAERAAIERYLEKLGEIPAGCVMVTTLSPCTEHMDDRRGKCCADMLLDHGIRRVYCGYQDPTQNSGFVVTKNQKLMKKCKEFADTFLTTMQVINEDRNRGFVQKFLPWVCKEIGLDPKRLPQIKFLDRPRDTTFGCYDPQNKTLQLVIGQRHPVDVLRTLAHELTHYKQDIEGKLKPDSGQTGSPEENEANSNAGIIMRNFAKLNPKYLGLK